MRGQSIRDRVTILFPGALGDVLLALPALRALRARHAAARLTVLVSERLRSLIALAGCADDVASLDGAELARVLAGGARPPWLAPGAVVYSWFGVSDETVRTAIAAGAASASFFRVERGPGDLHAAAAYARAVRAPEDVPALTAAGRIVPSPTARAGTLCAELEGPALALHVGAGARAKRWHATGYAAVATWWRAAGGTVLALLGPAEVDDRPPPGARELRDWPLPDLAAVLARSNLYLGNDSGISHLAAAVGARGVVLFGTTDPERWHPFGNLVALRAAASGADGIPLQALPVERVIGACRRALDRRAGDGREQSAPRPRGTLP